MIQNEINYRGCGCKKTKPVVKPQSSNTQTQTNTQSNNNQGGN